MPIGIGTAVGLGAAALGAGASIYSSSQASKAQSHAANQASATELANTQANNEFAQSIYNQNAGRLDPYVQLGYAPGNQINSLLLGPAPGGGTYTQPAQPVGGTIGGPGSPTAPGYTGPKLGAINSQAQMNAFLGYYQAHPDQDPGFTSIAPFHGDAFTDESAASNVLAARQAYLAAHPASATPTPGPATPGATPTPAAHGTGTTTPANAAQSAWNTYKNSTEYTNRLDTGLNATASKYAAGGAFESGAEKKAINDYAQTFASNEMQSYLDNLYRQEALGAGAASSLAGVGTNLVGQVTANNNNAASAAANAQLVAGQGRANTWNAFGSGVGQIAGAVGGAYGSSYGGGGGYDYNALKNSGIYDGTGWDF